MHTELQYALRNDDLQVVQKKIKLGSYPHAVYKKALVQKAWTCAQWIVSTFPTVLSESQWYELSKNNNIVVSPATVLKAHAHGVECTRSHCWAKSVAAWEMRGVAFESSLYKVLWGSSGNFFKISQYVAQLGMLHRFELVDIWLSGSEATSVPVEKEVTRMFKQLWDFAILKCDCILLSWLVLRADRFVLMQHMYNSISSRSLALPSLMARRERKSAWDADDFLKNGLPSLFASIDDFCQYVALYDTHRLRHVWNKINTSHLISSEWRAFLNSDATLPVAGHSAQSLVIILRVLFPTDEKTRMLECLNATDIKKCGQVDLVDIL